MPSKDPEYFKKYHQRNKEKRSIQARQRRYGVTQEWFDKRLAYQGGKCCICRTSKPKGKGWVVDHNHRTKKARGILCNNCNTMLGYAKDDPEILLRGAAYLDYQIIS